MLRAVLMAGAYLCLAALIGLGPARRRSRRPAGSIIVRLDARLRDGAGWRAIGYALLKLPLAFGQYLALAFWACGLADLAYPLWARAGRAALPGRLRPGSGRP